MLATDSESAQKKARAEVNPLAGLRLASALTAAWCFEESKIRSGGKAQFRGPYSYPLRSYVERVRKQSATEIRDHRLGLRRAVEIRHRVRVRCGA